MSKDLNTWRYKPKHIYILKIFEGGRRVYFVLVKNHDGKYTWQSLNLMKAGSKYFGHGESKRKAIRWATERGTLRKIKLTNLIPLGE